MGRQIKQLHRVWLRLPHLHRYVLMSLAAVVAVLMFWPGSEQDRAEAAIYLPDGSMSTPGGSGSDVNSATAAADSRQTNTDTPDIDPAASKVLNYDIKSGDSLSGIFDRLGLGQTVMYQILSADESLLALDVLRPGQTLTFHINPESDKLQTMELFIHAGNRVFYNRVDSETFEYEERIIEGEWPVRLVTGDIQGSFYLSARRAGLTEAEIAEVNRMFSDQFNFARDLRPGDEFEILRSEQRINGKPTGQTRIEAMRFHRYNRTHTAYLFDDGNYYDADGESLARAFRRYPLSGRERVSSGFNPRRTHPVTGRISPHNGTDFAVWTGTPVLSTGDGVVARVENHPYAGRYIDIDHGSRYTTRYMHLSRIDVRRGQTVARGERIGLSGATGRVTGPNLHYEFHVNDRPVNPMTANIPMADAVPSDRMPDFLAEVEQADYIMENAEPTRLASATE